MVLSVGAGQPAVMPAFALTMAGRSVSAKEAGGAVLMDTWLVGPLTAGLMPYSLEAAFQYAVAPRLSANDWNELSEASADQVMGTMMGLVMTRPPLFCSFAKLG